MKKEFIKYLGVYIDYTYQIGKWVGLGWYFPVFG